MGALYIRFDCKMLQGQDQPIMKTKINILLFFFSHNIKIFTFGKKLCSMYEDSYLNYCNHKSSHTCWVLFLKVCVRILLKIVCL